MRYALCKSWSGEVMVKIKCTIDAHQVKAGLEALGREAPRASMRAINRTLDSVRTRAIRDISADLGIAQKEIRGDKTFTRGHASALSVYKASVDSLRGSIQGTGKRIDLMAFGAKDTKDRLRSNAIKKGTSVRPSAGRGVTYRMRGIAKRIPEAFTARMASGHVGVFVRRGTKQYPIQELFGPSVPYVFRKHITSALKALAADTLQKNLRHEIGYLLTFGKR